MGSVETEPRPDLPAIPEAPAPSPPWQFSLRDAFWFTTFAAGAALLVRFKGPGSLVLSASLFLAWLNVRGRLARIQTPRARPRFFYAGWLLLLVSLFLPAAKGCNNTTIAGWQAAYACGEAQVAAANEWIVKGNRPEKDRVIQEIGLFAVVTLLNAANLLALFSPWLMRRLQQEKGQRYGAALAIAAVTVWAIPFDDPAVLVGCYVWCAGFLALTLAYRIGWKTFLAMMLLAIVVAWTGN